MKRILFIQFGLCLLLLNTAFAAVDFSDWSKYGTSLESCTAGTFNLPDPAQKLGPATTLPMVNYEIVGVENGICKVIITKTLERSGQAPMVMKLNCAFPTEKLPTLTTSARTTAEGKVVADDPGREIMRQSCKPMT